LFNFLGYVVIASLTSGQTGATSILYSPMIPRDNIMCLRFHYKVNNIRNEEEFAVFMNPENGPK